MSYQNIQVETRGRVGIIRLNRPQALNALNSALNAELGSAVAAGCSFGELCLSDFDVTISFAFSEPLVISGAGRRWVPGSTHVFLLCFILYRTATHEGDHRLRRPGWFRSEGDFPQNKLAAGDGRQVPGFTVVNVGFEVSGSNRETENTIMSCGQRCIWERTIAKLSDAPQPEGVWPQFHGSPNRNGFYRSVWCAKCMLE